MQRKSGTLLKKPDWEALRATLFGKFYETIVAGYFHYVCGFKVYHEGIAIDLEDLLKELKGLSEDEMWRRVNSLIQQGEIKEEDAKQIVNRFIESLRSLKEGKRRRFNPDLVLERDDGKCYVVEMQVWPVWLKRKQGSTDFSWNVIKNEGVAIIPRVLASQVKIGGRKRPIEGFYYITYSRGRDHENIEAFFRELSKRDFRLMYISEIVKGYNEQDWFKEIIENVEGKWRIYFTA